MERNRVWFKALFIAVAVALGAASPSFAHENHVAHQSQAAMKESPKTTELRQALRDLWIGHIFWVRDVALMTKIGNAEAAKAAEENVVTNARAIAGSIMPVYGKPAADKLFGLLAGHYGAVKEYMNAAYAGDRAGKDAAAHKLTVNGGEIAGFLSSANPNWPKQTLVSLLTAHAGHHMAQIDAFARNDFVGEGRIWEPMKNHMYMIADALAAGIAKQFPKKF